MEKKEFEIEMVKFWEDLKKQGFSEEEMYEMTENLYKKLGFKKQ